MKRYFVTGTDTGVGKTFVTAALARAARQRGLRVFAFKPIETGCTDGLGADQRELVDAAGGWQTGDLAGCYSLRTPVAPAVAASLEGVEVSLEPIRDSLERGSRGCDLVLVEGAGGWRVPITDALEMRDLARLVGPVLVAARAGLGTINHSLLTLEAIERDGLTTAALIVSVRPEDDEALTASNVRELQRRWSGPVLRLSEATGTIERFT